MLLSSVLTLLKIKAWTPQNSQFWHSPVIIKRYSSNSSKKLYLFYSCSNHLRQTLMWPISKRKTKNKIQNFVIYFLIWNQKTNFKIYLSFFKFDYWKQKQTNKKFDSILILKTISKNKNQNFRIHFLISNQKMNL